MPQYLRKKDTDEVFIRTDLLAAREDMEPYHGKLHVILAPPIKEAATPEDKREDKPERKPRPKAKQTRKKK